MEICVRNATKYIKGALILNDVNLTFSGGKVYGLQGPNGSGKTMLMRLISGLIKPTKGEVVVDGIRLGKDKDFPASMGIMIEEPAFLPNYTGKKNLELLASIRQSIGTEKICNTLNNVGLDPNDRRKYRKYSLGMKKRLGIAAALMEEPSLILLDEPTNALDNIGVEQICDLILRERDRGALIIIACHDAGILDRVADEVYTVNAGVVEKRVQQ